MLGTEPITGTVTTNPKAAQMSMMGIEMIEVNGKTWIKMGTDWTESTDDSTSSLADSFAPEKMFGSTLSGAPPRAALGEKKKNGVPPPPTTPPPATPPDHPPFRNRGESHPVGGGLWPPRGGVSPPSPSPRPRPAGKN